MTAARGLHVGDACGEGREGVQRLAEAIERQRLHVILQVGTLAAWVGFGENTELRGRHRERSASAQRIVEEYLGAAEHRSIGFVQRGDARHLIDHTQLQMVLEVFADTRLIEHDRNTKLPELRGGTDTGQKQRLY